MKVIFLVLLSCIFIACASKNTSVNDDLFNGNLVPINSEEIKQNLGEKQ